MPAIGLYESLTKIDSILSGYNGTELLLPNHNEFIYSPGCWVLLTAFARHNKILDGAIKFSNFKKEQYAKAIGLHRAVWGSDVYKHTRTHEGINYASLVQLDNQESTDLATQTINSCIRCFFERGSYGHFVNNLCDLIGDLHDNVWSHGKASGFSMTQKWKIPHSNNDYYLEFAVADHGMGFLSELKRTGILADSDQEAIEWCIKEGHSTKKADQGDDWAQSMPADMIGNPLSGIEKIKHSDNHHMGLGLFKLIEVIKQFSGELRLSTGNTIYSLLENGEELYEDTRYYWQGVAISCRFNTSLIEKNSQQPMNKDIQDILDLLRSK